MGTSRAVCCVLLLLAVTIASRGCGINAAGNKTQNSSKVNVSQRSAKVAFAINVTYPYLALVEVTFAKGERFTLSGVLLNKYWVLTQASSLRSTKNLNQIDSIVIRLGVEDSKNFISEHLTSEFYVNPRFKPNAQPLKYGNPINDLLLIRLQRPAIFIDNKIIPVSLPSRKDFTFDLKDMSIRAIGFADGKVEPLQSFDHQLIATTPVTIHHANESTKFNHSQNAESGAKNSSLSVTGKANGATKSNLTLRGNEAQTGANIQRIEFKVHDNNDILCQVDSQMRDEELNDGQICAVSVAVGKDPVLHGAPALWGPEEDAILVGTYSYQRGYVVIFTRIVAYLDWIERTTGITISES